MSVIIAMVSLFAMPVPAWIVLFAIVGIYVVQYVTITRKVESHGRTLSHLDRWANSVEARLDVVGQALGHAPAQRPARQANRPRKDSMTSEQVSALIQRIVGSRAA